MRTLRKIWLPVTGLILLVLASLTLRGEVVFDGRSDVAGSIRVVEQWNGLRELYLGEGRARQTALHLDRPGELEIAYTRVAMLGLSFLPEGGRILFVGLGGGSMPRFVLHHRPDAEVHAVELDPEVVRVAREFFAFPAGDGEVTTHVADGRVFIEGAEPDSWDLIVLDAFSDDRIPSTLATREFLEAVRDALAPEGVVVSNLLTTDPAYRSMLVTYHAVFPAVATVGVPGRRQRILLAGSRPGALEASALARRGEEVTRELGLSFELARFVTRDYLDARDVQAPVLEDPSGP